MKTFVIIPPRKLYFHHSTIIFTNREEKMLNRKLQYLQTENYIEDLTENYNIFKLKLNYFYVIKSCF